MVVSRITNDGAGGSGNEAQPGDQEAADAASKLTDSDIEKIAKNVSSGSAAKIFLAGIGGKRTMRWHITYIGLFRPVARSEFP